MDSKAAPIAAAPSWFEGDYLTGDPGGKRKKLEDHGIAFNFLYWGDEFEKLAGGIRRGARGRHPEYLGSLDFTFDVDTGKAGLYDGGEWFLHVENTHGEGLSDRYIGDTQRIDNNDVTPFTALTEYWYQHKLLNGLLRFRFGKQDSNQEFYNMPLVGDFIHSSPGCPPTLPLPRYNNYGMGLIAHLKPTEWFSFKTGVMDGKALPGVTGFDTLFKKPKSILEVWEAIFSAHPFQLEGNYRFGAYHSSGRFDVLARHPAPDSAPLDDGSDPDAPPADEPHEPNPYRHNYGWYIACDQMLYKVKREDKADPRGVAAFFQATWSPADRNSIQRFLGGGVVFNGLIPGRKNDTAGLCVQEILYSERTERTEGRTFERAIEAYYKIQLTPFFMLTPDAQFIQRPSGKERDAWVAGLRFKLRF